MLISTGLCFPRAGLLGNPSDGFGGKTIAFAFANWQAHATIKASAGLELQLGAVRSSWPDLSELQNEVRRQGHPPEIRLLTATLLQLREFLGPAASLPESFHLHVETNIPEQVGLAGSSAIIIAALRALMAGSRNSLSPALLASLALRIEKEELGIPAGLQDRVAQSFNGLVAMDFSPASMRRDRDLDFGSYRPLDPSLLPSSLYVAWSRRGKESTAVPHTRLRERFEAGDPDVVHAMREWAELAQRGIGALENRNQDELNRLIDANFDLRASLCPLNPVHVEMVRTARGTGSSAKYCGSGGAIVGCLAPGLSREEFSAVMSAIDCEVVRPALDTSPASG